MSGNIYNTPASNLENNIEVEMTLTSGSNLKFKKTMIMNIVGGALLLITGVALYLNKMNSDLGTVLIAIIIMYSILCGTAFGSAYAVRTVAGSKFQLSMLIVNWLFIGIFILGALGVFISAWSNKDTMIRMLVSLGSGIFMFVIPQLINIKALNQLRKNRRKA